MYGAIVIDLESILVCRMDFCNKKRNETKLYEFEILFLLLIAILVLYLSSSFCLSSYTIHIQMFLQGSKSNL